MVPLDEKKQHLCMWNKNLAPPLPPPVATLLDLRRDPATGLPYSQALGSNSIYVPVPVDPSAPVRGWFPVKAKTRNGQSQSSTMQVMETEGMGSYDEGSTDSRSELEVSNNGKEIREESIISRKRSSGGEKVDASHLMLEGGGGGKGGRALSAAAGVSPIPLVSKDKAYEGKGRIRCNNSALSLHQT
jgi:hypothetical protein